MFFSEELYVGAQIQYTQNSPFGLTPVVMFVIKLDTVNALNEAKLATSAL